MKKQIKRLSPHQNGKVFGILLALFSLLFLVPAFAAMLLSTPDVDHQGSPINPPYFLFFLFPLLYLVMGYVFGLLGSVLYNFMYEYIGGFEFEESEVEDKQG